LGLAQVNYLLAGVSAYHTDKLEITYGHLHKEVMFYPVNGELNLLLLFVQVNLGRIWMLRHNI
jgi:hypothetical protein